MSLATQIATDLSKIYSTDEFAQAVTYAGSSVTGIVSYTEDLDQRGAVYSSHSSHAATAELRVRKSEVASPAYRDTVVIGSVTWRVRRVISGDGHDWLLLLERGERPVI